MRFDQKTKLFNWIGYGLIVLGFIGTVKVARADDVVLSWTNPIDTEQCSNAGPYINPAGTYIWQLVQDVADPNSETFTLVDYLPGDYTFIATSYDTNGVGSRISGQTTKTVTTFTAVAGATVYQPVSIKNGFWLLQVGTVTSDIECIVSETVNGKYAIPDTGVSWSPGVIPKPLVVTDCQ